ncbi:MAG: hypothetical protein JNG88_16940 [Phycisphaerales bacterium]|nr:hypothetical protein [Phycisphaerales bacterium]
MSAIALVGCNGANKTDIIPPRDVAEALQRVNTHAPTGDAPLYCTGLVSIRFRDAQQNTRRFVAQPMTLIFRPDRCLYFNIKNNLAGSLARIGSNDDRFWLCVDDSDFRKMWWGEWAGADGAGANDLPVPPNDLLDALMLRCLSDGSDAGPSPFLRIVENDHRLIYVRTNDEGRTIGVREVVLNPNAPYLPKEIIDRSCDGHVVMRAQIENWRPVGDTKTHTARRYVVEWPMRDAELRIDIDAAKFRPDQPPFCEFPREWNGPIEQIGESAAAAPPNASEPGTP